ncbi:hypothetical protein L218DRAFT_950102 [Marasmius fiardii PR-910]|nr:hypothetical protein L218DRAFT_950102 [Marasmius fiardii PR-910]
MPTIYRNWGLNHVAEPGATDSELGKATLKLLVNVYEILEGCKDENLWQATPYSSEKNVNIHNFVVFMDGGWKFSPSSSAIRILILRISGVHPIRQEPWPQIFLREGKRSEWAQILRRLEVGGGKDSLSFYFENKQYIRDYRVSVLERYGQQLLDLTSTDPNIHGGAPRGGRMSWAAHMLDIFGGFGLGMREGSVRYKKRSEEVKRKW